MFGNAYWVGSDPESHWAECATIEISTDVNGNGVPDGPPDEPWYLIPGTHIPDPAGQYTAQTWDDDTDDDTYPPADATWIPPGASGVWTTDAHALPLDIFAPPVVHNPATGSDTEGIFGYADYTPTLVLGDLDADGVADDTGVTPDAFYTTPDDPRRVGITAGSGGGDAFDIAWAIDPTTGKPAGATGFDFIRVTSAVTAVSPVFGEKSAEIDAVADVAPDPFGDHDGDGDIDLADIAGLQRCFAPGEPAPPACPRLDRNQDGVIDLLDAAALVDRLIGPTP
ncbi:MAG: dockerin type I domain-containing protein [Phycisphaerae bacterium]